MNTLLTKVSQGIIASMKAKDKIRLNALRYLKKLLIENQTSKKPIAEIDVLIGHAKKLKDSIELYPAGSEQQKNIQEELQVFDEFLPKALTKEEVQNIITQIINDLDAPNMGQIMKELSPQIKGRFDGKLASQMVKDAL